MLKESCRSWRCSEWRWIGKRFFQSVGATKLKARREMLVGAKLLSEIYKICSHITLVERDIKMSAISLNTKQSNDIGEKEKRKV